MKVVKLYYLFQVEQTLFELRNEDGTFRPKPDESKEIDLRKRAMKLLVKAKRVYHKLCTDLKIREDYRNSQNSESENNTI